MTKYEYTIGSGIVSLDYSIMQTIETEEEVFVLLKTPCSEDGLNNVYSFNKQGNMNWRINVHFEEYGINLRFPFTLISIIDGDLYAIDFYERRFKIDIKTGNSLKYDPLR